jgi:TRAP-type C4-dicarboxylate transport system permease small subunit
MELLRKQNLAKYTFLYLLSLVTLVMTAMAVGNVLFELIDKFIPDPLATYTNNFDPTAMKMAIATLIIASPIYFFTTRVIMKSLGAGALDKDATPRRWLSYLIILISSFVMLGFLISVLFSFLDGELTLRFAFKALTALIMAGGIFGFYFYDVRRDEIEKKDKVVMTFGIVALVVVVASLIISFFFVESPAQARNRKHDQTLAGNFDQIDSSLNSYYSENKKLPGSLSVLVNEKRYLTDSATKDPANGTPIEYKVLGDKKYQLCATFAASNVGVNPNVDYTVTRWAHKEGKQCLEQQIFQADNTPAKPIPGVTVPLTK